MIDLLGYLDSQSLMRIIALQSVYTPVSTATISLTDSVQEIDLSSLQSGDLFMIAFHGDHSENIVLSNGDETIYDVYLAEERSAPGLFQKIHNVFTHIKCSEGTTDCSYTIYKVGV